MQAPKHEIWMLNWEIFDLNKKLQTLANVYSTVDVWTIDCLSQLISTVDYIMSNKSIKSYVDWDKKDDKIFLGYSFHHSINCKKCGRAVKIAKPSLMKHLNECNRAIEDRTSKKVLKKEVLEITQGLPRKTKPGNETKALNRNTSSQSIATVASRQNPPTTKSSEINQPPAPKKRNRRGQKGSKNPTAIQLSKSDASVNSTVSSINKNDPKEVGKLKEVNGQNPKNESNSTKKDTETMPIALSGSDNLAQSSSTVGSEPADSLEQLDETDSKEEPHLAEKVNDDDTPIITIRQITSTKKGKVASEQNLPKQLKGNLQDKTGRSKHPNEPKRKVHRPNRTVDEEYVTKGSIPNNKVELPKKLRKFIINVKPQSRLTAADACRKELSNSPAHDNIVKNLEGLFKTSYPKAKAYPFGSRITGLGTESSDLDIYLDLKGNYDGSEKYSKDKLKWCVLLTEEYLKLSDQWSKLDPVTAARTPILRAWNTTEKIDCDISFTHGLSHSNTKLIQYLFDLQPVCFYIALYAKEWSRHFSMDGLNTYTLVLLSIFYLQKHKLLPCIYSLQNSCKNPMFISHWQANFERKSLEELNISKIPETEAENHIVKFFAFYGTKFCFETRVICPLLGWGPQKEDFDPLDCEIPLEMENLQKYYDQLDLQLAHPVNDLLSYMKPMVVQDPFELNHNVAKGISPTDVNRFRKFCALTATLLDEVLNEKA